MTGKTSLPMALLFRHIFVRAGNCFTVELVTARRQRRLRIGDVTMDVKRPSGGYHLLLIPPFDGYDGQAQDWSAEISLVTRLHAEGTTIASACLGALLLAEAGMLRGREATTHWKWVDYAVRHYPQVAWRPNRMICDVGDIITAGGYLATVDLALYLVARWAPPPVSRALGQILLAGSVRQKQSVYSEALVPRAGLDTRFGALEEFVERHLEREILVPEMAHACGLSERSFHRQFVQAYGFTPRKLVQLKRVERAKKLLREGDLSVEEVVERVGVSDPVSFRRVFLREMGMSPSRYRKEMSVQL